MVSKEVEEVKEQIEEKVEELEENDRYEMTDDEYIDWLDGVYPEVDICGSKRSAGYTLQQIDEIMFNIGKSEEEDRIIEEKREELEGELDDLKDELEELGYKYNFDKQSLTKIIII